MPKRVQSPSSINTFKQCPRKYFYQYITKHPTKTNIHLIRGKIVHDALEKFFDIDINSIKKEEYKKELSFYIKNLFDACWTGRAQSLQKIGLDNERISFYYKESTQMLANWLNHLFDDLEKEMKQDSLSFKEAFNKLKPLAIEKAYKDSELMVRGFIDVIHQEDNDIILIDYKTSKSSELKDAYLLQLGIYALLYERQHGNYPKKVGLWFLKDKLITINVTPKLIKDALFEIEQIHFSTESSSITDYSKKESGLCRYSTGQCDFYEICMKDK